MIRRFGLRILLGAAWCFGAVLIVGAVAPPLHGWSFDGGRAQIFLLLALSLLTRIFFFVCGLAACRYAIRQWRTLRFWRHNS
jgi:hypothetical protein